MSWREVWAFYADAFERMGAEQWILVAVGVLAALFVVMILAGIAKTDPLEAVDPALDMRGMIGSEAQRKSEGWVYHADPIVEDMDDDESAAFMKPETEAEAEKFRQASEAARIRYRTERSVSRPIWSREHDGMIHREYMPANDVMRIYVNNTVDLRRIFQLEMG